MPEVSQSLLRKENKKIHIVLTFFTCQIKKIAVTKGR